MLDNIKNQIHQSIEELFASAIVDEMIGDYMAYQQKLGQIASIAEALGIGTIIVSMPIDLKKEE